MSAPGPQLQGSSTCQPAIRRGFPSLKRTKFANFLRSLCVAWWAHVQQTTEPQFCRVLHHIKFSSLKLQITLFSTASLRPTIA